MPSGAIDLLRQLTHSFNLNDTLLKGVLCFMLFRGRVNVLWASLHEQQWLVLSLAFADTAMTCLLTGALANTLLEQASCGSANSCVTRGCVVWKLLSKQATCGSAGSHWASALIVGEVAKERTRRVSRYRQWLVRSTGWGWCTSPRRTRPGVPLPPLGPRAATFDNRAQIKPPSGGRGFTLPIFAVLQVMERMKAPGAN